MQKYKVGSDIIHLKNCKDIDYVILDDTCGTYKMVHNKDTGEDLFYTTKEYLMKRLTFSKNKNQLLMYNYQYDRALIGDEFPIEYHILDYKNELIEFLMFVVERKLFNFNKIIYCEDRKCSKLIYHIAYNVFILQNNSPILTEEQLKIVQQIHDYQMPIDYIDTLTSMIYELKYPNNSLYGLNIAKDVLKKEE